MTTYVLDTNIIALILRGNQQVLANSSVKIIPGNLVLGCPMVRYEVRRGLLARDAKSQLSYFEKLFAEFQWQDYTPDDWELASTLWAQRRTSGRPIADADLLIAVFTMNRNAILITDNEKDFDELGVHIENWK